MWQLAEMTSSTFCSWSSGVPSMKVELRSRRKPPVLSIVVNGIPFWRNALPSLTVSCPCTTATTAFILLFGR